MNKKSILDEIEEIKKDFEVLGNKDAIVEYIIEIGRENTTKLLPEEKNEKTLIKGCASPAWMVEEYKNGKLFFRVEGTSSLAKGMIPLLLRIFNKRTPHEILSFDVKKIYSLGFDKILSPVRLQGLEAFLNRIYLFAKKYKENQ
jgi:cysteine desulfuration protein SufE